MAEARRRGRQPPRAHRHAAQVARAAGDRDDSGPRLSLRDAGGHDDPTADRTRAGVDWQYAGIAPSDRSTRRFGGGRFVAARTHCRNDHWRGRHRQDTACAGGRRHGSARIARRTLVRGSRARHRRRTNINEHRRRARNATRIRPTSERSARNDAREQEFAVAVGQLRASCR